MRPLCDGREADIDEDRSAVTVPPELARPLAAAARRGLAEFDRRNGGGGMVAPGLRELVDALGMSAAGRALAKVESPSWVAAGEAAQLAGITPRHARRLAASGKVRARRRGRDWEIDRQAAEDYGSERTRRR